MGQVKKLMMEYDETLNELLGYRDLLAQKGRDSEYKPIVDHIVEIINQIGDLLDMCRNTYSTKPTLYVSYILSKCRSYLNEDLNNDNLKQILDYFVKCKVILRNDIKHHESAILNSSEYYENEIRSLNNRLAGLTNELRQTTTMHQAEVASKEAEMRELEEQIAQYRKKEEQVKQMDDAKSTWKKAIEESFVILDNDIQPIKEEKQRLRLLYWAYCALSVLMLIILVTAEIISLLELNAYDGIPPFKVYLSLIVPIPVALALLFVFMTQINRAQRQMVSISKYIHDIKYIEGILLAINNLSVDIDDSMKRINNALDKLLDRHLKGEKEQLHEDDLKILENKDSIPTTQVLELLTTVLGRAEKNDKF